MTLEISALCCYSVSWKWKHCKSKWLDFAHFSTIYYFLVCSGVKMHIFNHKNNINWYAYIWSPALKMTRKRLFVSGAIHCENAIWNIQISAFNLYELKYLPGPFWKICSTHPQNFRDVRVKVKRKHGYMWILPVPWLHILKNDISQYFACKTTHKL